MTNPIQQPIRIIPIKNVTLMLTPDEARELADTIQGLDPTISDHAHVYDSNYKWELTVAIYTPDNLDGNSSEVRRLIEEFD